MTGSPSPSADFGWYNGFSPEQRVTTPVQTAAVRAGTIPRPAVCSICGVRGYRGSDNPVWFHDEDYANPLAAHHVCRECHRTLHRRFEEPERWQQLISTLGDGTRWFEQLTMDAASLRRPFELTYPDGAPQDIITREAAASADRS